MYYLYFYILSPLVIGLIVFTSIYLSKKTDPAAQRRMRKIAMAILLGLLTILLVQQIVNIIFPGGTTGDSGYVRVISKIVIDTALVICGLAIPVRLIGWSITIAGVARFMLIFFQLRGMDSSTRVIILFIVFVVLLVVGMKMFGKKNTASVNPINTR